MVRYIEKWEREKKEEEHIDRKKDKNELSIPSSLGISKTTTAAYSTSSKINKRINEWMFLLLHESERIEYENWIFAA